jgi:hypothetical protein
VREGGKDTVPSHEVAIALFESFEELARGGEAAAVRTGFERIDGDSPGTAHVHVMQECQIGVLLPEDQLVQHLATVERELAGKMTLAREESRQGKSVNAHCW